MNKGLFTLSFDVEHEKDVKVLPLMAKTLHDNHIPAIFACIGRWVEMYPAEHKEIVRYGHEIMNHSYSHPNHEIFSPEILWNSLTLKEQKDEIQKGHDVLKNILQTEICGFRTPHFGKQHVSSIYDLLKELDYRYSSSSLMPVAPLQEPPFYVRENLLEFPLSECPEHPGAVFDSWHCLSSPKSYHKNPKTFMIAFKKLLDKSAQNKEYANVYFDPVELLHCVPLNDFIQLIHSYKDTLDIMTYKDVLSQNIIIQKKTDIVVSAIIFARNEEKSIAEVIDSAKEHVQDVLVMDGHSTDNTAAVSEGHGARVILDEGKGKGSALRQSLESAKGNVLVFLDADGSHDPHDIPKMIQPLVEGGADLAVGSRFSGGSDELSHSIPQLIRTIGNICMNIIINKRWGVDLTDTLNGFRVIKKKVAKNINLKENIHTVEQEMIMKCLKKGFRVINIPTHEYCRRYGDSTIKIWRVWPKFIWCILKNLW